MRRAQRDLSKHSRSRVTYPTATAAFGRTSSFFTWHIFFSTRSVILKPVWAVYLEIVCCREFFTSSAVHDAGVQTAQLMVLKRGTLWPSCNTKIKQFFTHKVSCTCVILESYTRESLLHGLIANSCQWRGFRHANRVNRTHVLEDASCGSLLKRSIVSSKYNKTHRKSLVCEIPVKYETSNFIQEISNASSNQAIIWYALSCDYND